jgi:hypothetical protein
MFPDWLIVVDRPGVVPDDLEGCELVRPGLHGLRPVSDESAWGAVPGLLSVRFPRPLAEPGVRLSPHRALHGSCRQGSPVIGQGLGIVLPR